MRFYNQVLRSKTPFLFSILFYLLSGNDNFRYVEKSEERKVKREENQKETTTSCRKLSFLFGARKRTTTHNPCGLFACISSDSQSVGAVRLPSWVVTYLTATRFSSDATKPNKKTTPCGVVFFFGGRKRTRTADLLRVKQAL